MNITVYCGAKDGLRPEYSEAAAQLGKWIAENGHTLVFGGGKFGMMGTIARAVIGNGGKAVGVTPQLFIELEEIYEELTKVEVVTTLAIRRERMLELGDAYIAMPGGIGTLDEISEAIALAKLGLHNKPCIFLNTCGYYNKVKDFVDKMIEEDFLDPEQAEVIYFVESIEEINEALN